jgi:hypothetical protein
MGTAEVIAGCIRLLVLCLLLGMSSNYRSELGAYDECVQTNGGNDTEEVDCSRALTLEDRKQTAWVVSTIDECLVITGVWILVAVVGAVSGLKGGTAEKAAEAQQRALVAEAQILVEARNIELVPVAGAELVALAEPVTRVQPTRAHMYDANRAMDDGPAPTAYVITIQAPPFEPPLKPAFGQFRPPPPRGPVVHAMVVPGVVVHTNVRGRGTPLDGRPPPHDRESSLDRNPVSVDRTY